MTTQTPPDVPANLSTDPVPASTATLEQLESETPGGSELGTHDPYLALRHPAFRLFLAGSTLMLVGQQMQTAAVQWEVTVRTGAAHAAWALSMVGLVGALPVIALALPAGQLADKVDRKVLTVVTLLLSAVCSIGLAALSVRQAPVAYTYAVLLAAATVWAIGGPARSTMLAGIVPIELFNNATTWNSSAIQLACMGGPALAGGLIALGAMHALDPAAVAAQVRYVPLVYVVDAACSLAYAAMLAGVVVRPPDVRKEPATLKTLLAGIRFVTVNRIILATMTLDLFAVLLGGAVYLLPVYATQVLHVGAVGYGWMRAAPAIGAFCMAMVLAHRPPMKRAGLSLLWAVAGFGVATIIFGLSHNLLLSLAMLFLTGALDNVSVVVRWTLVQVLTPDAMRGRVMAVNNVFIGASNELGGFESGAIASVVGPFWSVVGGGIGTILVVIATAIVFPAVRKFGSLQDARPIEETPEHPNAAADAAAPI
jgi:MFS family permease